MALTIEQRPEKTLESGLVSKWNASATPLQYKFSSDLFPVNNVDNQYSIQSFSYDSSLRGTKIEYAIPPSEILQGDYIKIVGTDKIDGIYKVKSFFGSFIVIDFFTNESESSPIGTYIKYYKGYKA